MTAERWMKFYPSDWRSDAALHTCSLAARGLWMEMLCLMDEAKPRGHLKLGRKKLDTQTLATLVNAPPNRVEKLLGELQRALVFSVTSRGTIYCRKMVREEKWSKKGKKMVNQRWAKATENKGQIGASNTASKTLRTKNPESQESCISRLDAARAQRQRKPDPRMPEQAARDPPDFSTEPVEPSEALLKSRLVKR